MQKTAKQLRLDLFMWMVVMALFMAGIWMRLHLLNVPLDRDSYDEGVYWQSLRSMSTGASLYQQIFYSQPPFFLLSIYPIYALLGQTIWSARLGVTIISLCGFLGVLLLGKALAGRLGMLLALLLLVINPFYLAESQTLQADGPSTALVLLAVGLAYLWWKRPDGMVGYLLATLTGITLALSILTKLLALSALIPISMLAYTHLWAGRKQALLPILLGCIAFILAITLLLLPFGHAFPQLWRTVVTFHTDAKSYYPNAQKQDNIGIIRGVLATLLSISALYGAIAAVFRRDWRVMPLLAWFVATIYLLWQEAPLLQHHLVALVPPLLALSVMGISPRLTIKNRSDILMNIVTVLAITVSLWQVVHNVKIIRASYAHSRSMSNPGVMQHDMRAVHDLRQFTKPSQLVVTDSQFIAAMADRNTPAGLVDVSFVRINSHYLTMQTLIDEAEKPQVHAVLFYTHRLEALGPQFHDWVKQHFHLVRDYGDKCELWVR